MRAIDLFAQALKAGHRLRVGKNFYPGEQLVEVVEADTQLGCQSCDEACARSGTAIAGRFMLREERADAEGVREPELLNVGQPRRGPPHPVWIATSQGCRQALPFD